jgi:hypothetical protein
VFESVSWFKNVKERILCFHCLKGQCHEIFDLWFFSSNNPAGAEDLEFARLWLPLKGISIKKIPQANCTTL